VDDCGQTCGCGELVLVIFVPASKCALLGLKKISV